VRFDDATAARLLQGCGVERPALSTAAVRQLVDKALAAEGVTSKWALASVG
jgi:hypothetical protein